MLEWENIEKTECVAIKDNIRYNIIYFKKYDCWAGAMTTLVSFGWLTKHSKIRDVDKGYLLPEHKFATKEEAQEVCERHYKLLILQ